MFVTFPCVGVWRWCRCFFDPLARHMNVGSKKDPLIEINAAVPREEPCFGLERVWSKPAAEPKHRTGHELVDVSRLVKTDTIDLQQRPSEHRHRRHNTRNDTENGRVSSTSAAR